MSRNRPLTEGRLIDAVGRVLERSGVTGLNASAIAAQAGVDKALIYKYFGDLEGLLRRYGESADLWWRAEELLEGVGNRENIISKSAIYGLILVRFLNSLRRRPAALAILASEANQYNILSSLVSLKREHETERLFEHLGAVFGAPPSADERAGLATYMHAITYAVMLGRGDARTVYGVELGAGDPAWTRLEAAVMTGARAQFAA